eukprot:Blabericola_migrator_1__8905@NODE_4711_length_1011_cov_4_404661_g2928_i0_p2_GENE_NODE_4711_length_1011_cov_4_404661_g2928_i0NODE_4711_length_1011_cov_4_404661_g2928_i0_p2_ORF_typecomplete_len117_score7_98_NODE_4711_length_1011_cov_4_404661_g2928_i0283633
MNNVETVKFVLSCTRWCSLREVIGSHNIFGCYGTCFKLWDGSLPLLCPFQGGSQSTKPDQNLHLTDVLPFATNNRGLQTELISTSNEEPARTQNHIGAISASPLGTAQGHLARYAA